MHGGADDQPPATVCKAFAGAKAVALTRLADSSAAKVTLPFVEEQLRAARWLLGRDFWSYGLDEANRKTLETFLLQYHRRGLSPRKVEVDELFHPASMELFKIQETGYGK